MRLSRRCTRHLGRGDQGDRLARRRPTPSAQGPTSAMTSPTSPTESQQTDSGTRQGPGLFQAPPTSPTQKAMSSGARRARHRPDPRVVPRAGSDYALCADLIVASEDAQSGRRTRGLGGIPDWHVDLRLASREPSTRSHRAPLSDGRRRPWVDQRSRSLQNSRPGCGRLAG